VTSAQPPGRPRTSRLAIAGAVVAFAAIVAGFSWVAVKSFEFIHTEPRTISSLKPVKITGAQQVLFSWKRDACEAIDLPDAPARAFRDAGGRVHLIASHFVTRQATGPDLDHVRHRCEVSMRSALDPDPATFADKEWLFAVYALGDQVLGLVHDEYQGNTHPGRCPSGVYLRCWYNAVTLARSGDGGQTFVHARPPPGHLVAALPYQYAPDAGRVGVFQPSNIVEKDGYYYALVATSRYQQQAAGACLMRTNRLGDPRSWRAWDGDGFTVTFVDPYRTAASSGEGHLCTPVSPQQIGDMTASLTYNTYFGKYMLVGNGSIYSATQRRVVSGFYYSLSGDLVHWSARKLVEEAVVPQTYRCGDEDPVYYPSVLDPRSSSRNFETVGRQAYLYFTRFHYQACAQTQDRDLVRIPVEFSK
jgi:hypothetical protein